MSETKVLARRRWLAAAAGALLCLALAAWLLGDRGGSYTADGLLRPLEVHADYRVGGARRLYLFDRIPTRAEWRAICKAEAERLSPEGRWCPAIHEAASADAGRPFLFHKLRFFPYANRALFDLARHDDAHGTARLDYGLTASWVNLGETVPRHEEDFYPLPRERTLPDRLLAWGQSCTHAKNPRCLDPERGIFALDVPLAIAEDDTQTRAAAAYFLVFQTAHGRAIQLLPELRELRLRIGTGARERRYGADVFRQAAVLALRHRRELQSYNRAQNSIRSTREGGDLTVDEATQATAVLEGAKAAWLGDLERRLPRPAETR